MTPVSAAMTRNTGNCASGIRITRKTRAVARASPEGAKGAGARTRDEKALATPCTFRCSVTQTASFYLGTATAKRFVTRGGTTSSSSDARVVGQEVACQGVVVLSRMSALGARWLALLG